MKGAPRTRRPESFHLGFSFVIVCVRNQGPFILHNVKVTCVKTLLHCLKCYF